VRKAEAGKNRPAETAHQAKGKQLWDKRETERGRTHRPRRTRHVI
jgi:hypothetical protein